MTLAVLATIALVCAAIPALLYLWNTFLFREPPKPLAASPAVSVLIPARNEEVGIPACLESVLASRALGDEIRRDPSGNLLVWLAYPGFATYLHIGCSQIRRYGAHEPMVLTALLQMLAAVAANCVSAERRAAVQSQIDSVVRASQKLSESSDRAIVARAALGRASAGASASPAL